MFKVSLLEEEKILQVYRQSETILFKPAIVILVLTYAPWYFLIKYDLAQGRLKLLTAWTFLLLIYGLYKYLLWLINVYILSDKRLIVVQYKNFFNKRVLESPLPRILNVSYSQKGFWHVLFAFGTVEAQVAGLPEPILIKHVSRPSEVKDFIWKIHGKFGGAAGSGFRPIETEGLENKRSQALKQQVIK